MASDLYATSDRSALPSAAVPTTTGVSDAPVTPDRDAAAAAHGQQVFRVNCAFCHGSDGGGGENGPNLIRSPLVVADQHGEVIGAVVLNGRADKGMPKFDLSWETVADIAAFLHSNGASRAHASTDQKAILVGNAAAGKDYFYGKGGCSRCHSVKGDLRGIGAKYDPKNLQDAIISGGPVGLFGSPVAGTPPRTVSVTLSAGEVVRGTLIAIDDFNVTLTDNTGNRRSVLRHGAIPHIEVLDPRQAHLDLLRQWDDRDIHDVNAFLVKQQ